MSTSHREPRGGRAVGTLILALTLNGQVAPAQSLGDIARRETERRAQITTGRVYTNADLPPADALAPASLPADTNTSANTSTEVGTEVGTEAGTEAGTWADTGAGADAGQCRPVAAELRAPGRAGDAGGGQHLDQPERRA